MTLNLFYRPQRAKYESQSLRCKETETDKQKDVLSDLPEGESTPLSLPIC